MINVKIFAKKLTFLIMFLLCISSFFHSSQASIQNLISFKNFSLRPTEFNENTLVIFDVDDVLLMEEDQILRGNTKAKKHLKSLFSQLDKEFGPLNPEQWNSLKSEILLSSKRRVIEEEAVLLIKRMQSMGAKVIVLTACQIGACGSINSLPEWRIQELKHHNMDFSQAFSKIDDLSLDDADFKKNKQPLFKSGCLFSTGYAKGVVLKHFLKHLKKAYPEWKLKKVIFFDNQKDNLESVEITTKRLNILYKGLFYTFSEKLSQINLKLGKFQLYYLFKHKKWLTDSQARAQIK